MERCRFVANTRFCVYQWKIFFNLLLRSFQKNSIPDWVAAFGVKKNAIMNISKLTARIILRITFFSNYLVAKVITSKQLI